MAADALRRYAVAGVALCALMLSVAACAADGDPETASTRSATNDANDPSPTDPVTKPGSTADADAWRSKYRPVQLEAYDAALQRLDSFESRVEPIMSKGEATPAAERLFKEYFPHPVWRNQLRQLETYERYGVQIDGTPVVLWSRAASIEDAGDEVVIEQCVDYGTTRTTQNGEATKPIESRQRPVLRVITMSQPKSYNWLIYAINATPGGGGKKDVPCDPAS